MSKNYLLYGKKDNYPHNSNISNFFWFLFFFFSSSWYLVQRNVKSSTQLLPLATACTITQLIYPFFADRTSVTIFDLPRMLAIHLKMDINFRWYYIIVNIAPMFIIAIVMIFNRRIFTICIHNICDATML